MFLSLFLFDLNLRKAEFYHGTKQKTKLLSSKPKIYNIISVYIVIETKEKLFFSSLDCFENLPCI